MIVYDFEVFKYNWLVVFLDLESRKKTIIIDDRQKLIDFYNKNYKRIWIGFNNTRYDQFILRAILRGDNPKEVNDHIIKNHRSGWSYFNSGYFDTIQYDVMTALDKGLKTYEGFMGYSIVESSVPFDIDRKLTDKELEETVYYCMTDVDRTTELFIKTIDDFKSHMGLVKMCEPIRMNALSKTKAQLSSLILSARKIPHNDEFDISIPKNLKIEKYTNVVDWYLDPNNHKYTVRKKKANGDGYKKPEKHCLKMDVAGVPHVFAWGGLHGAINNYIAEGDFLMMDVASLYPSLMILYNLLSRNCGRKGKDKYKEIYHTRLKLKAAGEKAKQAPLKLVLNSTYGILKDKNNGMYDPLMANMVCIYGQLFMVDLIEKLEGLVEIIQSNTDGLLVRLKKPEDYYTVDDICYEWEKRTKLKLEFKEYKKVIQKDVNNYILIEKDGKLKRKGGFTKELSDIDNDLEIVNRALVNYFVDGTPVENTIYRCDDFRAFQQIVKLSDKFTKYEQKDKVITDKVIRLYASKELDGTIYKVKDDGKKEKIPTSSENSRIYNDEVLNKKCPEWLDKDHYINLTKDRINKFEVGDNK